MITGSADLSEHLINYTPIKNGGVSLSLRSKINNLRMAWNAQGELISYSGYNSVENFKEYLLDNVRSFDLEDDKFSLKIFERDGFLSIRNIRAKRVILFMSDGTKRFNYNRYRRCCIR